MTSQITWRLRGDLHLVAVSKNKVIVEKSSFDGGKLLTEMFTFVITYKFNFKLKL